MMEKISDGKNSDGKDHTMAKINYGKEQRWQEQ
jgi:hypothetical protein